MIEYIIFFNEHFTSNFLGCLVFFAVTFFCKVCSENLVIYQDTILHFVTFLRPYSEFLEKKEILYTGFKLPKQFVLEIVL